jgi:hypothetical protein
MWDERMERDVMYYHYGKGFLTGEEGDESTNIE